MQKFKHWILAIMFAASVGGVATSTLTPQVAAAGSGGGCGGYILSIPPWHRGLTDGGSCEINSPGGDQGAIAGFVWTIALNIVEAMLHVAGYVAVGFIIYGGFNYLTSAGQPDKIAAAKKSIMNAIVGLLISVFAIAIVNVVVGAF